MVARLNGTEIARTLIAANTSSYVLKTPLDDGLPPRLLGTARAGERIRIYLVNISTNTEAEAAESVTNLPDLLIREARGDVRALPLSTTFNLAGTSALMTSYGEWAAGYTIRGLSTSLSEMGNDLDRDGVSNFSEFIAGTDPTDGGSILGIKDLRARNGVLSLRFGPVRLSRRYIVETADSPAGAWRSLGTHRFLVGAEDATVDLLQLANPSAFFRVRVEIE